jgi:hypothetical protein
MIILLLIGLAVAFGAGIAVGRLEGLERHQSPRSDLDALARMSRTPARPVSRRWWI